MCNNRIHAPVCGKCKATGGQVGKCEHFAEERRGAWIAQTPFSCVCSLCGYGRWGSAYEPDMAYCPKCGNPMDGGVEKC